MDIPALMAKYYALNALDSLRCIVPTGRAVRHIRKQCVRTIWRRYHKPTPNLQLFTIDTFIRAEASSAGLGAEKRVMSDAFRFALMREAMDVCVEQQRLVFYSRDASLITLPVAQRLADIIYGLKRKGLKPDDLAKDLREHRESGEHDDLLFHYGRLHDVHRIWEAYEQLRLDDLFDMPSLSEALLHHRQTHNPSLVPVQRPHQANNDSSLESSVVPASSKAERASECAPLIVLDGFSEFTQPELSLLRTWAMSSEAMVISLQYEPRNRELFGNLIEARETLEDAGFMARELKLHSISEAPAGEHDETSVAAAKAARARQELQASLFSTDSLSPANCPTLASFSERVHIMACDTKRDEMGCIARFVKHCVHDRGIALEDIVVLLRQPQNYASLLREVFEDHGIAINMSDRASLSTSPLIAGLFAMINVVCGEYRRADLIRALSSPVIRLDHELGAIDVHAFQSVARSLRIEGGPSQGGLNGWIHRIELALESATRSLDYLLRTEADAVDIREARRKQEELARVHLALQFFSKTFPHRDKLCSPQEFHQLVIECFIEKLRVEEQLNKAAMQVYYLQADEAELVRRRELVEQSTRALGTFISLLDELEFILRQRPQKSMRFRDYAEVLESSVRAARVQIREKGNFGLDVTSVEQTRGIPYRVVILAGMLDLDFPLGYSPEYFLGKELPDSELRHIRAERTSFYHALSNPLEALAHTTEDKRGELFVSYARRGSSDEEYISSPFLKELRRLFALSPHDRTSSSIRKSLKEHEIAAQPRSRDVIAQSAQSTNDTLQEEVSEGGSVSDLSFYAPWIDALSSEQDMWLNRSDASQWLEFFRDQRAVDNISFVNEIVREYARSHGSRPDIAAELLESEKSRVAEILQRPVSASEIETYADCPYRYFAAKILGLTEEQTDSGVLNPLEKGNLLHYIVYRFYTERSAQEHQALRPEWPVDPSEQSSNESASEQTKDRPRSETPDMRLSVVDLNPGHRAAYLQDLHRIAIEELEKLRYKHPFFQLSEDELLGLDGTPGLLEKWLDAELQRIHVWQFKPFLFEWGFGMQGRGSSLEAVQIGELRLRGKVDRVELRKNEHGQFEFLVADYKSSDAGTSSNSTIRDGQSFQLPLYLSAVQELLRTRLKVDAEPGGAVYYIFQSSDENYKLVLVEQDSHFVSQKDREGLVSARKTTSVLTKDESRSEILEQVANRARRIEERIAEASFPIEPATAGSCSFCSFASLCRVRECGQTPRTSEAQSDT